MNTSYNKYDSIEKLIFDEGLKISSLDFDFSKDNMLIHLSTNLTLIVRLSLYKALKKAKPESLRNFQVIANGTGIHWPELDEDLSLKGFFKDFLRQNVGGGHKELVIA
jgi:hypothetical protein